MRTQIQLTEQQAEALKRAAARRGVSLAQVIRDALDAHLAESPQASRRARAVAAVGGFRSGLSDISTNHDEYLADDFGG